jgi:pimeloyl-ACP methyl ester carboxylesterase
VIPAITAVRMTGAAHRADLPLLVLGPEQGAAAATLWTATAAAGLTDHFDVLAWDLPGHGHNRSAAAEPATVAELAAGVLAVVDDVQAHRDDSGAPFSYAGVSLGGSVGLHLLLDAPHRVSSVVVLGTVLVPDGLEDTRARVLVVTGEDDPLPEQQPEEVAMLIRRHVLGLDEPGSDQQLLPGAWSRPGLDRRSRAIVTLSALAVLGQEEQLATHLSAAVEAGLTQDEIRELLAQAASHSSDSGS